MKVNLEEKLIKENQELISDFDLLKIREYQAAPELVSNNALERVGLNRVIKEGKQIQDNADQLKRQTLKYNQERVFHISQIESIAKKYHLRFLNSQLYNGSVDSELAIKITTFETAYDVICQSHNGYSCGTNTYIMAPARSFALEKKPKDPLFFYQINTEYYYLVHKWGNDLSIFRRLFGVLSSHTFSFFSLASIPAVCIYLMCALNLGEGAFAASLIALVFSTVGIIILYIFTSIENERVFSWIDKDNWDSQYL